MNFVFMDGCLTSGNSGLADAFGITSPVTDRAFLGWVPAYEIDSAHADWVTRLMRSLSAGGNLRDSIVTATAGGSANADTGVLSFYFKVPATPRYYGDPATTLHGVYGAGGTTTPIGSWFKQQ